MGSKSKSHSNADAERISNAIDEELKVSLEPSHLAMLTNSPR